MKVMKIVKLMKGGWHAALTWRPPAAAHRSVADSNRQDLLALGTVLSGCCRPQTEPGKAGQPRQRRVPAPFFMFFIVFTTFMSSLPAPLLPR